jgi:glyoxylase-like metal-dependent hydrolase (beta-lactamase superfamily II)
MQHTRHTIDCEKAAPEFVASYLRVAGEECAFVDTNTAHSVPLLLDALALHGRRAEEVRWVVVTHAHLDHAGGAGALMEVCPNATLLAHPRAARHLIEPSKLVASAKSVYGEETFASVYGRITPISAGRVRALEDGESFELGDANFRVFHTAGHAKHHFVIDDPATETVYTGDAFGVVYPRLQRAGCFAIASTSPTDFDAEEARKSIALILGLREKSACVTHFDEVRALDAVASQLVEWVDLSEQWLEDAVRSGDDPFSLAPKFEALMRAEIENKAARIGLALDAADHAAIGIDVNLNAQGLAFVAQKVLGAKS